MITELKVLFGAAAYTYLDGPGGIVNQMFATKAALERRGHHVDLFNPWQTDSIAEYDVFHMFFAAGDTYEVSRRIRSFGPKLVVSPIIDKAFPSRWIRMANTVTKRLPKHFTHLSLAADLCRMADLTVSRSADESNKLSNAFGVNRANICLVLNGVESKYAEATPDLFQSKHGDSKFLLAVGLVGNPKKNFLRLIKIANKNKNKTVIIGPIQNNDYAKACIEEAKKSSYVKVLGTLPENELISSYAAAHALILPTDIEGTGLVALEAGLAGANIAITQVGGPPDYFENYATYINPASDSSIETAMKAVMAAPKNGALKQHIVSNFLWDDVIAPLEKAYLRLIEAG